MSIKERWAAGWYCLFISLVLAGVGTMYFSTVFMIASWAVWSIGYCLQSYTRRKSLADAMAEAAILSVGGGFIWWGVISVVGFIFADMMLAVALLCYTFLALITGPEKED